VLGWLAGVVAGMLLAFGILALLPAVGVTVAFGIGMLCSGICGPLGAWLVWDRWG
jgi:hypothetical protein